MGVLMFSRQKPSKKWHRKALMIDPKKTILVLDRGNVRSEHVPPWIQKRELNREVREFFHLDTHDNPRL
jgi:hypothetical protein